MPIVGMPSVAPGDVITSAGWNVITANVSLLDGRTGGDPGAASKALISNGVLGAVWTALTSLVDNITTLGTVTARGFVATTTGVAAGAAGVSSTGPVSGSTGTFSGALAAASAAITGILSGGTFDGGNTSAGTVQAKGLVVGTDGAAIGSGGSGSVTIAGSVTPGSYAGGSVSAGVPSMLGLNVGGSGMAISYQIASSLADGSTPPIALNAAQAAVICTNLKAADSAKLDGKSAGNSSGNIPVSNGTVCTNLNAAQVAGKTPTATPGAAALPLADGSGKLDSWITTSDFPKLSTGGDFATAPTINGDVIAVRAVGGYTGDGTSARQITVGFECKYVLVTAYNAGANTFVRYDIIFTTAATNPVISGNYGTGGVSASGPATGTKLHVTDGFVVDAADFSNTNLQAYRYVAYG